MKLFDYRPTGNAKPDCLIEYLNNTLDFKITFSHTNTRHGIEVVCTEKLTPEQYKQLLTKLKLTSLHFTDKDNYVHN